MGRIPTTFPIIIKAVNFPAHTHANFTLRKKTGEQSGVIKPGLVTPLTTQTSQSKLKPRKPRDTRSNFFRTGNIRIFGMTDDVADAVTTGSVVKSRSTIPTGIAGRNN